MRSKLGYSLSAFLVTILAACGGSGGGGSTATPTPPPVPANPQTTNTTTSAYGVLGTATTRVAFVPSPGGVTPFLLENIGTRVVSWGNAIALTGIPPTVPLSFPVSACTVDSNNAKAVCVGFTSSRVAVLDLAKFADSLQISDVGVQEFDSGAGSVPIKFSGATCIICGIAADVGKQRFVIGGAGGYRVFNYGATTASAVYDIPVGENFAFLPQTTASSYIVAPEYTPNGGNRKLRVVDVDNRRVYVWTRNTDSVANADLGAAGSSFRTSEVDAASIDGKTKMIVLSNEDSGEFLLVDFGQAVFDNVTLTFSAPFSFAKPDPATAVARLTDVAISTERSILLSHGEAKENIGVMQLPTASGTGGAGTGQLGVFDLNDPNLDRTPCGAGYVFAGKGDPHGLSLYAGIDNGQRGLVIDFNNTCAAVVDLVGLLGVPHTAADPNQIDTSSAAVRGMVKFVKLR